MERNGELQWWHVVAALLVLWGTIGMLSGTASCEDRGGTMRQMDRFGVEWECVTPD